MGKPLTRLNRVVAVLLLLGMLRLFHFVLHTPLLAYGNNWDMIRMQACYQIRPADPSLPPEQGTPQAPLTDYRFDPQLALSHLCVPSSEFVFMALGKFAVQLAQGDAPGQTFSIRVFGLVRAMALAGTALAFSIVCAVRGRTLAAVTNALIFAAVLTDPGNLLYLNTFYTEFSALFFAYTSLLLLYAVCARGRRESPPLALALAVSLALLGLSKNQHLLLPLVMVACLASGRWRDVGTLKLTLALALAGSVLALGYQYVTIEQSPPGLLTRSIRFANATNAFLGAVLPAASDPHHAAAILGLPPRCADQRGQTWYTPGLAEDHPCPEVLHVSRLRLLGLIAQDPPLLVRMTREALTKVRQWIIGYGQVGGVDFGKANTRVFTISNGMKPLLQHAFAPLFLLPLGCYVLGAWAVVGRLRAEATGLAVLMVTLASLSYSVFYAALFGDGYTEFARHIHLYFSLYLAMVLIALTVAASHVPPRHRNVIAPAEP